MPHRSYNSTLSLPGKPEASAFGHRGQIPLCGACYAPRCRAPLSRCSSQLWQTPGQSQPHQDGTPRCPTLTVYHNHWYQAYGPFCAESVRCRNQSSAKSALWMQPVCLTDPVTAKLCMYHYSRMMQQSFCTILGPSSCMAMQAFSGPQCPVVVHHTAFKSVADDHLPKVSTNAVSPRWFNDETCCTSGWKQSEFSPSPSHAKLQLRVCAWCSAYQQHTRAQYHRSLYCCSTCADPPSITTRIG